MEAHSSRSGTQVTSLTSAALSHVKTISLIKLFYFNNQRHQCPLDFTLSCFVKQDVTHPIARRDEAGRGGCRRWCFWGVGWGIQQDISEDRQRGTGKERKMP